ncbi:unnamed protein product [Rotaria magnacalcarata]|uniref:Uncharacterized protein n=1 Tax=Rotaria magnacalcarata TaxID=392030 RepID=A0A819MW23_9BILA|nr:unnamed protein product [Rotaria magnacalcarata]CAF1629620.1 unnamed protein product [Rotaria magnacalcarata]CAF3985779.1 unnamed protein product [Rotaria magnacalcarata]CAF4074443.1 unnamed protein product [Rotaria magnacalcarata]CAF4192208.1 unnamed protein product [Rotaria magnacalcarata]
MVPYPVQLIPVIFNIQIQSSTFVYSQNSQRAIQCTNAEGVQISRNYFNTASSIAPVLLCNTKNISASNNNFISNQSALSQFYTYDNSTPCLTSLTSLINLLPSAFNETFLPPIIATGSGIQINVVRTSTTTTSTTSSTSQTSITTMASDLYSYCEQYSHDEPSPSSQDPTAALFSELIHESVHDEFKQELKTNMVLYIVAGATHSKHTGKNLATKLRIHLCNYARDIKGFQYAFIQTMSPATRHIYVKKMNGKEMKIVDLATWQWKKKDDGSSYSFKNYHNEPAVNILIDFNERK